ncbi:MAG: hypothetical protein MJY87_00290 [Fibrobacter sp.]|nr:hypothetical protein [Fibrobacter sp.]
MNKNLGKALLTASLASVLGLTACGDSSSTSSNVEREEDSSSSVVESSSSVEESSSSVDESLPKGARVATLEDLQKNVSLGEMFGTTAYLATGAKHDVFSIWVPDTAWAGFYSEFKDGTITFGNNNGYFAGIDGDKVTEAVGKFWEKGGTLRFIVNEKDKLQYSLNGGDFKDAETAKVAVSGNVLSDGDKLKGLKLQCKNGDAEVRYTFYEGRFLQESEGEDGLEWNAGYYDIQRSKLLLLPVFYNTKGYVPLSTMAVDADFNITSITGAAYKCTKSSFEFEGVSKDDIAGEWASEKGGLDWMLTLDEDGSYQVQASKVGATEELKSGSWDVYGDLLLLRNRKCLHPEKCVSAVKGVVTMDDKGKGFEYEHSDPGTPEVPTTWTEVQYE